MANKIYYIIYYIIYNNIIYFVSHFVKLYPPTIISSIWQGNSLASLNAVSCKKSAQIGSSSTHIALGPLDSHHDIHDLRHTRHYFLKTWFQNMAAQAHIPTTSAAQIPNTAQTNAPSRRADFALLMHWNIFPNC